MKRLQIRDFGPLKEVNIELKRLNIIIGEDNIGKNIVMKVAYHCAWFENFIEMSQSIKQAIKEKWFIRHLKYDYDMEEYLHKDTYIEYETDCMRFSYNNKNSKFNFEWKDRWGWNKNTICYIPSGRNVMAFCPYGYGPDNVNVPFLSDWVAFRKEVENLEIPTTGICYHYDSIRNKNEIVLWGGRKVIDLANASGGLQSLIPLLTALKYHFEAQYNSNHYEGMVASSMSDEYAALINIYNNIFKNGILEMQRNNQLNDCITKRIRGYSFAFKNKNDIDKFQQLFKKYTTVSHSDLYIEEPEAGLFPPMQKVLMNYILDGLTGKHPNSIFISTHSPYILSTILEKQDLDFGLFIAYDGGGPMFEHHGEIKTATKEDIQSIYDYDTDCFFNLESFIEPKIIQS